MGKILLHRCQWGAGKVGSQNIVKANHRDIFGDIVPAFLKRAHGPKRNQVTRSENGVKFCALC